jgi:hypothetical protein
LHCSNLLLPSLNVNGKKNTIFVVSKVFIEEVSTEEEEGEENVCYERHAI